MQKYVPTHRPGKRLKIRKHALSTSKLKRINHQYIIYQYIRTHKSPVQCLPVYTVNA